MKKDYLAEGKTVVLINRFPDMPTYSVIGTTVFNNDFDKISDTTFKDKVAAVVIKRLKARGVNVEVVSEEDEDKAKNGALVLKLVPRDVYMVKGTFGYGISQQSLLGVNQKAFVYVALNIDPYKGEDRLGRGYYKQVMYPVFDTALPPKWEDLTEDQKQVVKKALDEQIEIAVSAASDMLGI